MILMTTMGIVLIEQLGQLTDTVRVSAPDKVLDSIAQTIELTDTEEGNAVVTRSDGHLTMSKGTAALWVTHELLNYIDYTSFGSELLNLNQTSLAMLYERLRIDMELL